MIEDNGELEETIGELQSLTPFGGCEAFNNVNANPIARGLFLVQLLNSLDHMLKINQVQWEQMIAAEEHLLERGEELPSPDAHLTPIEIEEVIGGIEERLEYIKALLEIRPTLLSYFHEKGLFKDILI